MTVMVTEDPPIGHRIAEGELHGGLPCLRVGSGPPLVVLRGLTGEHRNPTGMERSAELRTLRMLTDRFTVHLINRRPGLTPGVTMHDLASDVASAIRAEFDWPVPVMGVSTGGSIALQLAVDNTALVQRMVLLRSGCRLGPNGRRAQRTLADQTRAGRPRRAWAPVGRAVGATMVTRTLLGGLAWLTAPASNPKDPSDLLATIEAEDAFDVTDLLHRVTTPTLVVGGGKDGFYTSAIFERTAHGILGARLLLYPRKGHLSTMSHKPAQREIAAFLAGEGSP
jgi:pimeloyl-ACP methyl ester carboxylesterase